MNIKQFIDKNAPELLAAAGIIGFCSAVIMTARVAPEADDILQEMEDEPLMEKAKAVAPLYAPVAGMVLISTGCIMASTRIQNYRYASVLALLASSEGTLLRWQNAVKDEVSKRKAQDILDATMYPEGEIPETLLNSELMLFYDQYSGRYFEAQSTESIRAVVNNINEEMLQSDFVEVNEFYFQLGLPPTQYGQNIGWAANRGLMEVIFSSKMYNGKPIGVISFRVEPKEYSYR